MSEVVRELEKRFEIQEIGKIWKRGFKSGYKFRKEEEEKNERKR